jgi:hypothetical protein
MNERADPRLAKPPEKAAGKRARRAGGAAGSPEARNGALVVRPAPERNPLPVRLLSWWMRALAIGWLAVGLTSWALIVGLDPGLRPFEARATTFQAITIFFAVVDLTAAVGLWLLTAWGGVVWLIAAVARLVLAVVLPQVAPLGAPGLAAILLSLAVFAALIVAVLRHRAREQD